VNVNNWMILEYDPSDPTRLTLRRVSKEEYLQVWIENNLPYAFGPALEIDLDAIEVARIASLAEQPPTDDHQRAHERSKADRRRKHRKGKHKWGGAIDER
jgi:hypothetical protein